MAGHPSGNYGAVRTDERSRLDKRFMLPKIKLQVGSTLSLDDSQ